MALEQVTTHETDGLALLTDMFREKPITEGLLASYMKEVQELENVLFQIKFYFLIDNAVGDQLDKLGDLVGIARGGVDDDDYYRELIRWQILVNRSRGTSGDMLRIVHAFLGNTGEDFDWEYSEWDWANFRVEVYQLPAVKAKALKRAMKKARAAGTSGDLFTMSEDEEDRRFIFGSIYGAATGERGYATTAGDSQVDSYYIAAIRT